MGSTRIQMLLWSAVLLAVVSTSFSNFGVKVQCYYQSGTVVCPGCNTRAGLSCRKTNNMKGGDRCTQEKMDVDDDTCGWSGDCPCPLVCCNTGDGCPKRCAMGIRLPPPWG